MARRYVPKTYNNRRVLRIIFWTIFSVVVSAVALFLLLFFLLERYVVYIPDGGVRLEIPWLMD